MANVVVKNLSKSFGEKHVLEGIDLEISDKEFCVLVGPSGCGKSTLLRIIAGLEVQNSGDVIIGDNLVNNTPPKDRDIAFVFQSYALYPHLSVFDNIAFSLKVKKVSKEIIQEKVAKTAAMLGLEELLKRKPKELSGGQRQRVALGRAIVREPKIFLMDEPLSNLDAKLRVQMRSEIKKLQQKLATTCIYVTHDQVEALTMGDRIVVLDGGKIQQIDTPQNIYDKPINTFVAGFMGNLPMNIIKVLTKDFNLEGLPCGNLEEILIGFRPDEISDVEIDNSIKFEVNFDFVESLGSYKIAYFELNNTKCSVKIPQNASVNGIYKFWVNKNSIHLFDVKTKTRLPNLPN